MIYIVKENANLTVAWFALLGTTPGIKLALGSTLEVDEQKIPIIEISSSGVKKQITGKTFKVVGTHAPWTMKEYGINDVYVVEEVNK